MDDESEPLGTMTIRVPVDAFETVLTRVGGIGEVIAKRVNGEDVTGQVFDLESRLRNKRAEEAQYVEIMRKTKRIADIINVSNELFRVRGEIEQLQGRVKYLRASSDMSTVTVTFTEKVVESAAKGISGVWQRATQSLKGTSVALLGALIWIGVYAPYWIVLIVLVVILARLVRKRLA
jgi:hypothetical protein